MSLQPIGPLPASTYWRRRALVLGVVLLLLLVVLKACSGGGDSGGAGDAVLAPEPSASDPVTSTPSATAEPSATTQPPATADPPAPVAVPPAAVAPADCADAALTLVAATDAASYALGSTARLTLALTNTGPAACVRAVGQGALSFTVTSGEDRIWSSDDCSPGGAPGPETLAPGAVKTVTLPWSLKRSGPGCAQGRPALQAGTYNVVARVGTLASAPASFRIAGA